MTDLPENAAMTRRGAALVAALLVATMMAAAALAWIELPADARVAIHFDALGNPNGWSAPRGLFVLPIAAVLVWGLFAALPRIDPRGNNLVRSSKAYGTIWVVTILLLCVLEGAIVARALGAEPPMSRLVSLLIAGFMIVTGNVMGKIRWNYMLGIRTPWTLADEGVWDQTHRFGGWTFVAGGVLLLGATFTLPPTIPSIAVAVAVILGAALASVVKSYLLWRHIRPPAAAPPAQPR